MTMACTGVADRGEFEINIAGGNPVMLVVRCPSAMARNSDTDENQDERGEGFPQIIHNRARTAAEELHKLLLSLSTGTVAVYFIALTSKVEPPLTRIQQLAAATGLLLASVATCSGLIGWYADAQRNYLWASGMQANDNSQRSKHYRSRDQWLKRKKFTSFCLGLGFSTSLLVSVVYICLRIFRI